MVIKKMSHKKRLDNNGFTILELLIATAISSGAILMLMFGFLSISQSYTKGLTVAETQNTARGVADTISQSIQFGDPNSINTSYIGIPDGWFCADNSIFVYQLGQSVSRSTDALMEGSLTTSCPDVVQPLSSSSYPGGKELLGPNMRLTAFSVTPGPDNTYVINLRLAYSVNNTFLIGVTQPAGPTLYYDSGSNQVKCSGQSGQDFCSTAGLQTVVASRIAN